MKYVLIKIDDKDSIYDDKIIGRIEFSEKELEHLAFTSFLPKDIKYKVASILFKDNLHNGTLIRSGE